MGLHGKGGPTSPSSAEAGAGAHVHRRWICLTQKCWPVSNLDQNGHFGPQGKHWISPVCSSYFLLGYLHTGKYIKILNKWQWHHGWPSSLCGFGENMILVHKDEICACANLHPLTRQVRHLVDDTGVSSHTHMRIWCSSCSVRVDFPESIRPFERNSILTLHRHEPSHLLRPFTVRFRGFGLEKSNPAHSTHYTRQMASGGVSHICLQWHDSHTGGHAGGWIVHTQTYECMQTHYVL